MTVIHHFEGASQHPTEDVRVAEVRTTLRQLDELGKRVVVEDQRELVARRAPVGNRRLDAEKHLEAHLEIIVLLWKEKRRREESAFIWWKRKNVQYIKKRALGDNH